MLQDRLLIDQIKPGLRNIQFMGLIDQIFPEDFDLLEKNFQWNRYLKYDIILIVILYNLKYIE